MNLSEKHHLRANYERLYCKMMICTYPDAKVSELTNYDLLVHINNRLSDCGCQKYHDYEILEISEAMQD